MASHSGGGAEGRHPTDTATVTVTGIPIGRTAVQGWGGVLYLWGSGDATFFIWLRLGDPWAGTGGTLRNRRSVNTPGSGAEVFGLAGE
jgi:hypothetical protein